MEAARESDEELHSADAANAADASDTAKAADASSAVDASFSSAEDGGGEDGAEFPHLPARVDSSTFTRPIKKTVKNKKISRQPLRVVKREAEDGGGGGAEGKEEAEVEEKHPTIAEGGDFADADRFNNSMTSRVFALYLYCCTCETLCGLAYESARERHRSTRRRFGLLFL